MKLSALLGATVLSVASSFSMASTVMELPNVFVFGDFKGWSSDIEGTLVAKGSVELYNYGVNTGGLASELGAYIGGNLTLMSGQIVGSTLLQGALYASSAGYTLGSGAAQYSQAVNSLEQQMVALSQGYAASAATGTSLMTPWNGLELHGGSADLHVFNLSAGDLAAASYLQFFDVPAGSKVVLNVFGDTAYLANKDLSDSLGAFDTLLNFVGASNVYIENTAPFASILAPTASITGQNGQIKGTVVASSWSAQLEVHSKDSWLLNCGAITPSVPEPSTWLMFALGLCGIAYLRGRRGRIC